MNAFDGIVYLGFIASAGWFVIQRINTYTVQGKRQAAAKLLREARYQELMEAAVISNKGEAQRYTDELSAQFTTAGAEHPSSCAPAAFSEAR